MDFGSNFFWYLAPPVRDNIFCLFESIEPLVPTRSKKGKQLPVKQSRRPDPLCMKTSQVWFATEKRCDLSLSLCGDSLLVPSWRMEASLMFFLCVELRVSKTRNREGLSWIVLFLNMWSCWLSQGLKGYSTPKLDKLLWRQGKCMALLHERD